MLQKSNKTGEVLHNQEDNNEEPKQLNQKKINLSLSANSDTYIDQNNESQIILDRIDKSSSAVIGIAGVRGAGKSSLSLKVLSKCEDKGFFTLLIHSPTNYEPREFLLSVYQRICEATISRLESLFGLAKTLEERGKYETSKLRRRQWAILTGFFIIFLGALIYSNLKFNEYREEQGKKDVELRRQLMEKVRKEELARAERGIEYLDDDISKLEKELQIQGTSQKQEISKFNSDEDKLMYLQDKAKDLKDRYRRLSEISTKQTTKLKKEDLEILGGLKEMVPGRLSDLEYLEESFFERPLDEKSYIESRPTFLLTRSLPLLIIFSILYVIGLGLFMTLRSIRKRYGLYTKYPKERGLYGLVTETLEHLKYQTTITSHKEASASIWKLAANFAKSKELETRPISLPGMTSDCSSFLSKVAEVYGGKIVICLDELDKITETKELTELLKGVKGILGQDKTYFLLTVSEDALAQFSTRLTSERGMFESSLNDILFLDRVSFTTAQNIIKEMLVLDDDFITPRFSLNCRLIWLFGSGIPREIKRNVITCVTNNIYITDDDPYKVWEVLFISLLDSVRSSALIDLRDDGGSYQFLRCLENIRQIVPTEPLSIVEFKGWYKSLVDNLSEHCELPFLQAELTKSSLNTSNANADNVLYIQKSLIEVAAGAVALLFVLDEETDQRTDDQTNQLIEILKLLPYHLSFSAYKFSLFLKQNGIIEEFIK